MIAYGTEEKMLRSIKEDCTLKKSKDSDCQRDKMAGIKRRYSETAEKGGFMPPFLRG